MYAHDYDFCFVPNYAFNSIKLPSLDLGINIASFQEMSNSQVDNYLFTLSASGCKNFYSLNRSCSPYNNELDNVFDLLAKYFSVDPVSVLPDSYLSVGKKSKKDSKRKEASPSMSRLIIDSIRKNNQPPTQPKVSKDYIHHCGSLLR